ncbi:MAG: SusC/RagA family TonB-linked outer membrane protein [Peptostreptococcaceae bacterium]|nr:SusC/RagA family TonB-linked outer membrane protein [Peptostreptococcaceae bacterium]
MKLIRIVFVLCGMCIGSLAEASGQTIADTKNTTTIGYDSLVHVAYGTVAKNDLIGAISVIKPSEYLDKNYGTYSLDNASAFIGGSNLWNLGTSLVLIDGVPRALGDVISTEIDQISYLKGANAVVLYGSRAANGVILITTKRGKVGDLKANVRVNGGINVPKSYPDFLGSSEYMTYYNQASLNDGLVAPYSDATIANYSSHSNTDRYPDLNYYSSDYLKNMSNLYSTNAEFTGGDQRARFYAVIGLQSENSLLNFGEGKNDKATRLNVRGNIDLKLTDVISTYVNVSTVFNDSRSSNSNYWSSADTLQPNRFSPLIPTNLITAGATSALNLADASRNIIDGKYILGGSQQYLTNPIADVYAAGNLTTSSRQFQYTGGVDFDLKNSLKGLSLHTQLSIDYSNSYRDSVLNTYAVYSPTWSTSGADSITGLTKYSTDGHTGIQNLGGTFSDQVIDFNMHLDYVNTFNGKHNVSGMLVAAATRRRMTGDFQNRTNANLGLQLEYNYNHKYYADFSGALVNSTKLPAATRVAFSPTLSLSWLLSGEDFLKNSSIVDRLKLTGSAGIVNTDVDINDYYLYNAVYVPTAYFGWYDATNNQASSISRAANHNLTYAKRKEINLGLEGSLFNKVLDFQASAFSITKDGLPVQRYSLYPNSFYTANPASSFVPYVNYGANLYQGFDFQLNFNKNLGEVNLKIGISGTYVATKVLKRDELYADSYRNRVGKPTDAIFGLQSEGFFTSQDDINNHAAQKFGVVKPGDIKYKDQNGDGYIDDRDEVQIGQWSSPFTGGMNFSAQWKGFTVFVLGTAQIGGTGVKNNSYYWEFGDRKYSSIVRNSWTEETKNTATYPRLTTLSGDNNFRYSDFWAYSTDRINLSRVQLTYSLPKEILKNINVKGLDIYASGSNLLTIAKNRDIMELNVGSSPQTRFFNLGIKAEF